MDKIEDTLERLQVIADKCPKQLPLWPDNFRGAPNELIRSSLFSGRRSGAREHHKDAVLFVLGDGEITYRGEELRTFDEDVWLQVMHLARLQHLGECIQFTAYSLIKAIGWVKGKNRPSKLHYDRLKECLSRMQATTITVRSKRIGKGRTVSLIRKFEYQGEEGQLTNWRVWIEPEMKPLYGDVHYTQVEWEQRAKLSPTAKRLHGYFASHRNPYPVKIDSLHKMCNLKSKLFGFKQKLPGYLNELKEHGFLQSYEIIEDIVRVKRAKMS